MTDVLIPYSFVPGTKAMASEVNANFIALAKEVENCKSFTNQSIEDFGEEVDARLDVAIGDKLNLNFSNSVSVTNCITEIPQRIKLELNDGVLTIKAGSQFIVPNGFEQDGVTLKFDDITLESDIVVSFSGTDRTCLYLLNATQTGVERYPLSIIFSGATAPTVNSIWYDTNTNTIKKSTNAGVSWETGLSFPIGLFTESASGVAAVNNVFNGFGFIGQCVFTDKGVKALISDGRNEDGTLKNKETITNKIVVSDESARSSCFALFDGTSIATYGVKNYFEQDVPPIMGSNQHGIWYNTRENLVCFTSDYGATWIVKPQIKIGTLVKEKNVNFTAMNIYKPFRAVDYNQLEEVDLITAIQSKAAYGFCKLSNGMLMQWGRHGDFKGEATVTFPTPFSSTAYQVVACGYYSGDYDANWYVGAHTTTTVILGNPSSGAKTLNWIAIGF